MQFYLVTFRPDRRQAKVYDKSVEAGSARAAAQKIKWESSQAGFDAWIERVEDENGKPCDFLTKPRRKAARRR